MLWLVFIITEFVLKHSNGFNSILDLTENNVHPLNQKAIFTDEQWKQLNHAWNKRINWNPISKGFTEELKEIEKVNINYTAINKIMIYQLHIACRV